MGGGGRADSTTAALALSWVGMVVARGGAAVVALAAPLLAAVLPALSHPSSDIAQARPAAPSAAAVPPRHPAPWPSPAGVCVCAPRITGPSAHQAVPRGGVG